MDNGCNCRLCTYDREFAEQIAFVPEGRRAFFEELKDRWEHADADAGWLRAHQTCDCEPAIADTQPKAGDVKQAPLVSGGGAVRQSPITTRPSGEKAS